MKRSGDDLIEAVTTREVSAFLRELDGEDIGPKTVNKHRELLHAVFNYAMRSDTYGDRVKRNPVTETDKRRQPPPAPLDHYERHEIEALVRVCEQGRHRAPRHYKGRPVTESADELAAQAAEDRQDAAAFRPRESVGHEPLPALEARRQRRRGDERRARDRVVTLSSRTLASKPELTGYQTARSPSAARMRPSAVRSGRPARSAVAAMIRSNGSGTCSRVRARRAW